MMHPMCKHIIIVLVGTVVAMETMPALQAAGVKSSDQQVQIIAQGMHTQDIANKISDQLSSARGVKSVTVDLPTRTVTVSLSKPSPTLLGKLWNSVEQVEGDPTKIVTHNAVYRLDRDPLKTGRKNSNQQHKSKLTILIDNLHCKGCANKIAAKIYPLKGVMKVSANISKDTMTVQVQKKSQLSPWAVVEAVTKAKERPLAISGSHGNLAIQWATNSKIKNHKQAHKISKGNIQK